MSEYLTLYFTYYFLLSLHYSALLLSELMQFWALQSNLSLIPSLPSYLFLHSLYLLCIYFLAYDSLIVWSIVCTEFKIGLYFASSPELIVCIIAFCLLMNLWDYFGYLWMKLQSYEAVKSIFNVEFMESSLIELQSEPLSVMLFYYYLWAGLFLNDWFEGLTLSYSEIPKYLARSSKALVNLGGKYLCCSNCAIIS